jgi:hypothetical protein
MSAIHINLVLVSIIVVVVVLLMAHNVLQLGKVADLEALTFNLVLMFNRNPNVQFNTEPAILPNCC